MPGQINKETQTNPSSTPQEKLNKENEKMENEQTEKTKKVDKSKGENPVREDKPDRREFGE